MNIVKGALITCYYGRLSISKLGTMQESNKFITKVGGFCALSGVFILTLPIPIVVNRFLIKIIAKLNCCTFSLVCHLSVSVNITN